MARPGFSLDKKFRRLAHDLDDFQAGFGKVLGRGALELLWDTAYEACTDEVGDAFDVEAAAEWRGPGGRLVKALLDAGGEDAAGFIEEGGSRWWPDGKPGKYRIHDLWDHAPDYAAKRLMRENEREKKGKTIRDLRSEAGKKGAAAANAKRRADVEQAADTRPTPDDEHAATVRQIACTPSPAPSPAPAPKEAPPQRARLVSPFPPGQDPHPLTTAVLAALYERGLDAAPPGAGSADRVEAAIAAATLPLAIDRLAAVYADPNAKKPITFHVEAIRGVVPAKRTHGDLGAELSRWQDRLTESDLPAARAEWREAVKADPEFADAPLGILGVSTSPAYEAIRAFNEKWRTIAEARA
jgi:hypothetical protein